MPATSKAARAASDLPPTKLSEAFAGAYFCDWTEGGEILANVSSDKAGRRDRAERRPRFGDHMTRTKKLTVMVSADELRKLKKLAEAYGMSASSFVRVQIIRCSQSSILSSWFSVLVKCHPAPSRSRARRPTGQYPGD